MQFAYIRMRDAFLALALVLATCFAGASYRHTLAEHFTLVGAAPPPVVVTPQSTAPSPSHPVRVITRLPDGAAVLDRPTNSGSPLARIRPGAVVEVSATDTPGWRRLHARDVEGWVSEVSLVSEAESSPAIALLDSVGSATGDKVGAAHSGVLYANPKLSEHIGGFLRGESLEILRNGGRILLVAVADGGGGRVVGYARTAEVRALAAPVPALSAVRDSSHPTRPPGASEPVAAGGSEEAFLRDAQDQYASGNFKDALAGAEEAAKRGSAEADVLAAMAACKLGDLARARHHARRLRGARLDQFRAACPEADQPPPARRDSEEATQTPPTTPSDGASEEQ